MGQEQLWYKQVWKYLHIRAHSLGALGNSVTFKKLMSLAQSPVTPFLKFTLRSDFLSCHMGQIHIQIHLNHYYYFFTNNGTSFIVLYVFFIELNWDLSKTMFKLAWDFQKATDGIVTHDPRVRLPGRHVMCWSKGRPANPTSPSFYKNKAVNEIWKCIHMNTKIKILKFVPDGGLELRWAADSSILGSSFVRRSEQLNSGLLPTINEFY